MMAAPGGRYAAACLFFLAAAAGAGEVPAHGRRLSLPALHAEPDPAGSRLVDARGREVLLRGVNVNALAEYWQYGAFPTTFGFDETDADRIAAIGWNVVRLLVSWSRVEPSPGIYDEDLRQVTRATRLLARHNTYTIIEAPGLRRLRTQPAWGELYVVGTAVGGDWSLMVHPVATTPAP